MIYVSLHYYTKPKGTFSWSFDLMFLLLKTVTLNASRIKVIFILYSLSHNMASGCMIQKNYFIQFILLSAKFAWIIFSASLHFYNKILNVGKSREKGCPLDILDSITKNHDADFLFYRALWEDTPSSQESPATQFMS